MSESGLAVRPVVVMEVEVEANRAEQVHRRQHIRNVNLARQRSG